MVQSLERDDATLHALQNGGEAEKWVMGRLQVLHT